MAATERSTGMGLPLCEALQAFCPPEWKALEPHFGEVVLIQERPAWPSAANARHLPAVKRWENAINALRRMVESGEILMSGLSSGTLRNRVIPSAIWPSLEFDLHNSNASGHGLQFHGLRFKRARKSEHSEKCRATREWVKRMAKSPVLPETKSKAIEMARVELGELFVLREFQRAWQLHAPSELRLPGRPPNDVPGNPARRNQLAPKA